MSDSLLFVLLLGMCVVAWALGGLVIGVLA
uniref:Uncharacterized protein n=1 Tax=Arundo donax TaxID=35708 RepID=A0A0A8Y150_ARUDO